MSYITRAKAWSKETQCMQQQQQQKTTVTRLLFCVCGLSLHFLQVNRPQCLWKKCSTAVVVACDVWLFCNGYRYAYADFSVLPLFSIFVCCFCWFFVCLCCNNVIIKCTFKATPNKPDINTMVFDVVIAVQWIKTRKYYYQISQALRFCLCTSFLRFFYSVFQSIVLFLLISINICNS